jgi:hypothetical protein
MKQLGDGAADVLKQFALLVCSQAEERGVNLREVHHLAADGPQLGKDVGAGGRRRSSRGTVCLRASLRHVRRLLSGSLFVCEDSVIVRRLSR